ncbi:phosphoglycolate phosphatase [Undibacterium sp. Jales W-56]|uniref:phosphoglycolate phosphatase n=1 Tax=Undibacterium sp. Jales W-56 TaxID=2897325 RepID=UPI0021D39C68|nr:phosphoglycolate phosphatase [Undibacterium sp. Jales W-56]MCU6435158.1 phosphoglycolate phosphatase [Undibacterium sp. Jales W-56]
MLKNIQAVIIDLDGTMLDTAPDFLVAINRMRAELGLTPLDITTITNFVGKGSENLIHRVLAVDFDEATIATHFEAALAAYQHHYLAINGDYSRLYPKVIEGLDAMRARGLRLACVTNKPMNFTLPLLAKKGLSDYFAIVYGGDSFPRKKPDPMALLQVCRDFKLLPAQVLAIGDSSNDAQAARAAGCPVLHVPYGYNHGEAIQNVDTDGIVGNLWEAAQLLSA